MHHKFIKTLYIALIMMVTSYSTSAFGEITSAGKHKDWETFVLTENNSKVCFAQSIPVLRAPKNFERNPSRLFITFRPDEDIKDEISVTTGYIFQNKSTVKAKTGKKTYDFFSQEDFAWIIDNEEEQKFIRAMKKASRVMIIARTEKGKQTIDHYSLMGFSKSYESAKKNCS